MYISRYLPACTRSDLLMAGTASYLGSYNVVFKYLPCPALPVWQPTLPTYLPTYLTYLPYLHVPTGRQLKYLRDRIYTGYLAYF